MAKITYTVLAEGKEIGTVQATSLEKAWDVVFLKKVDGKYRFYGHNLEVKIRGSLCYF